MRLNFSTLLLPPKASATPQHFHVLDLSRGLAALAVLFWHFQHFYVVRPGSEMPDKLRSVQPLYALLGPLYRNGFMAVQFFWLISGFVFAAVYIGKTTSTRSFVVNRLARLYPLHFITLLIVAVLQLVSIRVIGRTQIYGFNDLYHFALQLFLASNWKSPTTATFNGPIWSVSVEVLFYGLFWITRSFLYRLGMLGPMIVVCLCWLLTHFVSTDGGILFSCGQYFFSGVVFYLLYRSGILTPRALATLGVTTFFAALLLHWLAPSHVLSWALPFYTVGMLSIVLSLEPYVGRWVARRLHWIGDSTYGIYLWHVPIQIALLILFDAVLQSRDAVASPLFLIAFIVLVVAVARISYVLIEAPLRKSIRQLDRARAYRLDKLDAGIPAP